jgi:hypothetical protein
MNPMTISTEILSEQRAQAELDGGKRKNRLLSTYETTAMGRVAEPATGMSRADDGD